MKIIDYIKQLMTIFSSNCKHLSTRPLYYELKEMPYEVLEEHGDECCDMEVGTECGVTTLECSTFVSGAANYG